MNDWLVIVNGGFMRKLIILKMMLVIILLALTTLALSDARNPFVDVVKQVRGSVVNIQVEYEVKGGIRGNLPFDDDFFKFFFPQPESQMPSRKAKSMGTGFIFKREGDIVYLITNNHVVEKGNKEDAKVTVTLEDQEEYRAEIVGLDKDTDLAVLKIEIEKNDWVTIAELGDSDELEVGEWAIAIGNPFGEELNRTVTVGVISATGRSNFNFGESSPLYQDYIQTDAAINRGNSGGPLVDIDGKVIGVNAAISTPNQGNVGIGFAIPVNMVKSVIDDLMIYGEVVRAYLGILPQEIDSDLRKSLDLKNVSGVLIAKVEKDTPAEEAGLKKGDVIVRFNGQDIINVAKFRIVVAESEINKEVPVEIIRSGKNKDLWVKLIKRPEDIAISSTSSAEYDWLGLKVESVNSSLREKYKIEEESGVIISEIANNSPAEDSELRVGDVIIELEYESIDNVDRFNEVCDQIKDSGKDSILMYVKSVNGPYHYVAVNLGR